MSENNNNNFKFNNDFVFEGSPIEVKVNGNFDRAMRTFRALVQKERVLSTYKEKSRYEKPSDKRRRKNNEMKRKLMELDMKSSPDDQFSKKKDDRKGQRFQEE